MRYSVLERDKAFIMAQKGPTTLEDRFEYDPRKDLIGRGSCGTVYRAFDKKYKANVAVKIIAKV